MKFLKIRRLILFYFFGDRHSLKCTLLIHERPRDDSLKYFIRLRNRYRSRGIPRGNVTAATKQKLLISAAATVEQFPLLVGDISFVRDHV